MSEAKSQLAVVFGDTAKALNEAGRGLIRSIQCILLFVACIPALLAAILEVVHEGLGNPQEEASDAPQVNWARLPGIVSDDENDRPRFR